MRVATFGPGSAWEGREIYWDDDRYVLYGHGPVPASGVVDYDRQGHLQWASPEIRNWTYSVAQWEAAGKPAIPSRAAAETPAGRRFPAWAIILIVAGVSLLVLGLLLAILIPAFVIRTGETIANDVTVGAGVRNIQMGIETYAVDHGGTYPDETLVNSVDLSPYIPDWPVNPYTGLPMARGQSLGNFVYDVDSSGRMYRLVGYGRDGKIVVELTGGESTTY